MSSPNQLFRNPRWKLWLPLAAVGLVASVAGLAMPQFLGKESLKAPTPVAQIPSWKTQEPNGDLQYTPPTWPETPDYGAMFSRLVAGTVIVLGMCVGVLWLGKRWLPISGLSVSGLLMSAAGASAGTHLKLVETLSLGNRCCLHLVQMAERQVLVGVDGSGVKTVVPLTETFAQTLRDTQLRDTQYDEQPLGEQSRANQ